MQTQPTAIDVVLTAIVLSGIVLVVLCGAWYLARDFWQRRRVMSNVGGGVPPAEPVRDPRETPGTYQANRDEPDIKNDAPALAISHNMTRRERIILLAVLKDEDGAYSYSANKIADFVGGTRAETLSVIASIRPALPIPAIQYRRPDGSTEPPTHPVSGRPPLRTHPR